MFYDSGCRDVGAGSVRFHSEFPHRLSDHFDWPGDVPDRNGGNVVEDQDPVYLQIYRFWLGIFAMAFGVGVVTGLVLSFEFGLGFAHFAQIAGPVIGPIIALEVLTSFFLEAGFLGIMLFGFRRVGQSFTFRHFMVALGTRCPRRGFLRRTVGCRPPTAWRCKTVAWW